MRTDANLSDKDRRSGRISFSRPPVYQSPLLGLPGGPGPSTAFMGTQKTYSSAINYDRVFSRTLIAEFRFGVAHDHNEALNSNDGTAAANNIGIAGANVDEWSSRDVMHQHRRWRHEPVGRRRRQIQFLTGKVSARDRSGKCGAEV